MVAEVVGTASSHLFARATELIPGGVNSNVRLSAPSVYFSRGKGAWLWDVDGRDYVDYLLGQGPAFLGHANERVDAAVRTATANGMVFGGQHELELEAAERICLALGWPEMVRLGMTGTEMVQAALRLARAFTGRRRFVRFEGHYHGWLDNVLIATHDGHSGPASKGQPADSLDDSVVLGWNDADALSELLAHRAEEIAAVIMEPVMLNAGSIEPRPGYLERARELCTTHGIVLIFDEVISGFRLGLGGAAEAYGVTPDLAVYGKAMAGGWPVAALAGRAELLAQLADGSVNHSGTFNGSVMAAAAICGTLELLAEDPPYERVARFGRQLSVGLSDAAGARGVPLRLQGPPMAFHASFGPAGPVWNYRELTRLDLDGYARFTNSLVASGIWLAARGVWYISDAHGPAELAATLERVERAFGQL